MKLKRGSVCLMAGCALIAAALGLVLYNLGEENRAEASVSQTVDALEAVQVRANQEKTPEETRLLPDYIVNPDMEMPVEQVNGVDYIGVLRIPALELELSIARDWSYETLRTTPCRYVGSAYRGDMVICAHNFSSHFGRLKELSQGDTVTFTDMAGNLLPYEVVGKEIIQPTAVEDMLAGDWDLSLFTCTVGGQTRVAVRCQRTDPEAHMGALH